jgi:GNAT superfamily N-acetyltransferase
MIQFRPPTIGDASDIGKMHAEVYQRSYKGIIPPKALALETAESKIKLWNAILSQDNSDQLLLLAIESDKVAGFICVAPPRDDNGYDCELWVVNVHHDFQKKGVGKGLVQKGIEWAKNMKYKSMYLWVIEENKNAINFYINLGFRMMPGFSQTGNEGCPEILLKIAID